MTSRRALVSSAVLMLALIVVAIGGAVSSPVVSGVGFAGSYAQSFDSLANTAGSTTNTALPPGWMIAESLGGARDNGQYAVDTGASTTGDTYSYGAAGSTERALGSLRSGSLGPTIGVRLTNSTSGPIAALDVAYTGEEWRLGTAARTDQLDFQYSTDATSLTTGTWTDVDALDFVTPDTATTGAKNGNAAADRRAISGTVAGLDLAIGSDIWFRWNDVDATSSDDGLAIDDLTVATHTGPVNQPVAATCGSSITTTQGVAQSQQVSATDPDGTVTSLTATSSPASAGITLTNVQPATAVGGTAIGTLNVASTTATGTYTVTVKGTNNDASPQSGTCTLTVTVNAAPTTKTIGEVQGSLDATADPATFRSPFAPPTGTGQGQTVTVRGVVTEPTYEQSNSGTPQNGFYLQDAGDGDPNSSDGIYVFTGTNRVVAGYTPTAGDEIFLTAKVSEFFGLTELSGTSSISRISSGNTIAPIDVPYPADARWWERHEGMQVNVPAQSVVTAPTHFFASTADTEFYVVPPGSPIAQRANPYAQRTFRDAHPLDGSADKIDITDEGIKASNHTAQLPPTHTFQKTTAPISGGVYFSFSKYSVSASAPPAVADGPDPAQNDPPVTIDRGTGFTVANYNMENLYDFRDDPFDGCDMTGNAGCTGVSPPFDYVPASDAEYQGRESEIASQVVNDLHSPDVIMVAEAEDQDICTVDNGALACGTVNNADGRPDVLQELALKIQAAGGPVYDTAFNRNGADARGIICAFMFRSDRVSLIPAADDDPVLGTSSGVNYPTVPATYNSKTANPKALNAKLPDDVIAAGDTDGTNVFTRAVQVAHFLVKPAGPGYPTDVWLAANHFSSGPDSRVKQRTEQANYDAAVVHAIQAADPSAKILVGGDLNVYPRPDDPLTPASDQLRALYDDAHLHNLYDTVIAADPAAAYSYTFDGNAQDLDHQFVSQSLFDTLKSVHEAHINSDWPRVPGSNRGTSDHDPMVSEWSLRPASAPVAHANGPYAVDEYGTVALHATSEDADPVDTASYAWDLDGNGSFETPGQDATFAAGDGPATAAVAVQVTDSFGLTSVDHATITIRNVPPTASFHVSSDTVTAGGTVELSLTDARDVSADDTAAGFEYAFDCGAGFGDFGTASTVTCAAPARGTLDVGGKIRDGDGGVSTYTGTVTVNGRSPVADAGGPYSVDEGQAVTLTASATDADGDTPITYAWDLDGNGTFETAGQSVTYHAGDGPDSVSATVQATDTSGATGLATATIAVRNVAATATFNTPAHATVGVPFAISLTDPHDYDTALQYAFDCGGGYGAYGSATSATCTSVAAGPLTVRGSVKDKDGAVREYTATVTVDVTFDAVCAIARASSALPQAADKVCNDLDRAAKFAAKGRHSKQVDDALDAAAKGVRTWGDRGAWTPQQQAILLDLLAKL